ncbi:MAG: ArsR family transcriptional regulator [Candidatus Cloacimonadota bacterium]|nr:MAG: ArsR family transcriptional regulator [Candidatus Cloacimonadota bacterium]
MKQKRSFVLDEEENEAVQLFSELGMPKNLAKTLLYVSEVKECCSADIEQGADLRQPEVSVAMRELRKRRWITKRDLKKKGKGRPVHIYSSTKPLSEILKTFEQEKLAEVEGVKKDLSKLKNIIVRGKIGA